MKKLALLSLGLVASTSLQAAIIPFDLFGSSVNGLLHFLNEPSVASGGTGGEIGAGIFFDDGGTIGDGGTLTLNVGWGSSQGFTDLSSPSSASHIHFTANNFGFNGVANFTQTGGTVVTLTRSSNLATGGTVTNAPIALNGTQEADLFNGKYYINIHTSTNGGGEIRAFMVPVPEPSTAALAAAGLVGLLGRRGRKA